MSPANGLVREVAMASMGDKVRVLPNKSGQPAREGVVTAVSGDLLRIRWSTGEESSLIPGPGAVMVVGRARPGSATKTRGGTATSAQAPAKKAAKASGSTKSTKVAATKSSKAKKK